MQYIKVEIAQSTGIVAAGVDGAIPPHSLQTEQANSFGSFVPELIRAALYILGQARCD